MCALDIADPGVRNREGNNIHLYVLGRGFFAISIGRIMHPSAIPSYEHMIMVGYRESVPPAN